MNTKNALVYSVTYENYQNKILTDKENKTQGSWKIHGDMLNELKYAYVYLKNSNQMIVKKYEIKYFELNDTSKGYNDEGKQCFIFNNSEDVFFEYPWGAIQGRHYRNDEEMDALPRLDKGEVDRRLEHARTAKTSSEANRKKRRNKTGIKQEAQVRLARLWEAEFSNRKMPPLSVSLKMIANVEEDPEQDLNALITEYYVEIDKKNQV
jgi:hypothetical protein|tara:strand:- start:85 stop:708 length:624 start_codon:yes stop_codon:yes gene_type:complete